MNIREMRSRLKWKRTELATFLGLDLSTVSRLENGQQPHGSTFQLLRLLNRSLNDAVCLSVLLGALEGDQNAVNADQKEMSRKRCF